MVVVGCRARNVCIWPQKYFNDVVATHAQCVAQCLNIIMMISQPIYPVSEDRTDAVMASEGEEAAKEVKESGKEERQEEEGGKVAARVKLSPHSHNVNTEPVKRSVALQQARLEVSPSY